MAGVFTITADDPGGELLGPLSDRVHRMTVDIVDDVVEHAGAAVRERAPGSIAGLVEQHGATVLDPGIIHGVVGVTPAHEGGERGKTFVQTGSDPRDYPFYVHQGTGVFGEFGTPITVPSPGFMQIDFPDGRVRTRQVEGQRPQPFVEEAFEETADWIPIRLASARLPSGGT